MTPTPWPEYRVGMSTEVIILLSAVLPLVITVVIVFFVMRTVRDRAGQSLGSMFGQAMGRGPSPADQQQQAHAMQHWRKVRARLINVRPTGLIVNQINVGVDLTFQLEPLDGGAPFQGTKRATVSQTMMPRIGDVWPGWVDPADASSFMVAMPNGASPEQVQLYRQFGIPHPLDNMPGAAPQSPMGAPMGAPMGSPMPPPPSGASTQLDELDRLSRLRAEGSITEAEFQSMKARLFG
jgi:hypothetical protein